MDLHWAVAQLPEKYQDVVKLKYFDGCTIREISQATGMPEGPSPSICGGPLAGCKFC